jgi:hypothetical protein
MCQDFGSGAGLIVFITVRLMVSEGDVLDKYFLAVFAGDGVVAEEQHAKRTVILERGFEVCLVAVPATLLIAHVGVLAWLRNRGWKVGVE